MKFNLSVSCLQGSFPYNFSLVLGQELSKTQQNSLEIEFNYCRSLRFNFRYLKYLVLHYILVTKRKSMLEEGLTSSLSLA